MLRKIPANFISDQLLQGDIRKALKMYLKLKQTRSEERNIREYSFNP